MSDQHKPQPTLSEAEQTELHQSLTANAGPPPGTTPPAPYPVFDANGRWPGQDEVSGTYLNETKVFNIDSVSELADAADGKAVDTKRLEHDKNLEMMRRMRGDIGAKMSTNANVPNGPFPASKMVNDASDLMFLTARSLGKTDPLPVLQMLRGKLRPEHNLEGVFDSEVYSNHFLGKKYGHSGAIVKALLGDTHGLKHTANPVSIRNMTQAEVAEDLAKPKPKPSSLMQGLLKRLAR